jgi:carbamoyltransferase
MAAILGISALYHDAAAALVVDGRIVAAIQEERLSRIKNDPSLPERAARACLAIAGLCAADLDRVVFYENPYAKVERVLSWVLRSYPRSFAHFPRAMSAQLGSKIWVLDGIADMLDVDRARVGFLDHHLSHAASAFYPSPYPEAAVITVDGVGEEVTTAIYRGKGTALERLDTLVYPHSLGLLYAALTAYLGFEVNEGEYKVMGLAAFGSPRFAAEFERLIRLSPDGSFELDPLYFRYEEGAELGFSPALEKLLGPARAAGKPWDLTSDADGRYADVAASLQRVTELALLGLCRRARARTGLDCLCLAGGVALNATATARILRESGFARVFVQPAAGDAGGALGAALYAAVSAGDPRSEPLASAALGESIAPAVAFDLARELGFTVTRVSDPVARAAEMLSRGEIVGVCSGRGEWGPRALGQRSLFAAPNQPGVREHLNRVVKQREPFRPFAPAVRAERAHEFFHGAPNDMTPYMTTVCSVHESVRDALTQVTHVDGSARVQSVSAEQSPLLGALVRELERQGSFPVVLNTSLNGPGEPIVARAEDALGFLCAHPLDALLIEDLVIRKGVPA